MERSEAIDHIGNGLEKVLNKDVPALSADMRLTEDLGLDSTTVIELLMALEDEVDGLALEPDELEADVFNSVGTLADYLVSCVSESTRA